MDRRGVLAGGLTLAAWSAGLGPAWAIDAGTSSGRYKDDAFDVTFSHAVALELDNAEGLLDSPKEIRVLLTDRELPVSVLYGQSFPPIWRMAQDGKAKGLYLRINPADRNAVLITILDKPEPGYSLTTMTLSNSGGIWSQLEASPTRVSGELKKGASEKTQFRFSAPVFTNAVEQDIKGPAAATSEPAKVLIARAQAIAKGDMAAAAALSTESSAAQLKEVPPEYRAMMAKELPKLIASLRAAKRTVIRRETAVVIVGKGEYASAAKVGGVWKAAD